MMTSKNSKCLRRSHRGFTLIELSVVIIILGIMTAMTLPQFAGVSDSGSDTAARAAVEGVISTAGAIYEGTTWLPTSTTSVANADPDLTVVDSTTPSTGSSVASVATSSNGTMFGVAILGSGECWMEAWNTDDTSATLGSFTYAMEATNVSGFSCSASFALRILTCPQIPANDGASWNSPMICDLSDPE